MTTQQPIGFFRRWNRRARRLAVVLLLLGLCALGLVPLGQEAVDELLRSYIQNELSLLYPELEVRLRGARRDSGEGLELRGLTLRDPQEDPRHGKLLTIEEIQLRCPASLRNLFTGDLRVHEVVLRRPQLRAVRDDADSWNLEKLRPLGMNVTEPHPILARLNRIVVESGELSVHPALPTQRSLFAARDIQLTIRPPNGRSKGSPKARWHFLGHCLSDRFQRATVEGSWDEASSRWEVGGEVNDIQVVPELAEQLPQDLAESLRPMAALRGRTDLVYRVSRHRDELTYDVKGHFYDGWIRDAALPYSLTDLQANFRVGADGVHVSEATARLGAATLHLDLSRDGFSQDSPLRLHASTQQFPLDHRLPRMMPESLRELWQKFLPSGTANITMTLVFDGEKYQPDVSIDFPELSLTFYKFPYRVHNATGTLRVKEGVLRGNLKLPVNGQNVQLQCEVHPTDEGPIGWAELQTDGPIPLDDAILAAFSEKAQQTFRTLQPSGLFELKGRFERTDPSQAEFQRHLEIELHNGAIRYEKFPLPIDRICGAVIVHDDAWSFKRLTGRNDSAFIVARGSWDPDAREGHHLDLDMVCSDVPLQDGLRQALNEDFQQLWTQLRPRGTIDHLTVGVRFHQDTRKLDVVMDGEKWPPEQNVEGRSLSLKPVWFPYQLENMTGRFHYENGILKVRDLRAEHGDARLKRGEVICSQDPNDENQWTVEFPLLDVETLEITPEFLAALPSPTAQGLGRLGIRGPLSVAGSLLFTGYKGSGLPPTTHWNLVVDMENGELNCGVKLQNVRGGVTLQGMSGSEASEHRMELYIDALMFRKTRFTQVRGPLRLDGEYLLLGAGAEAEPNAAGLPRSITGRVHDGEITLDGWLGIGNDDRFDVVAHLAGADLGRLTADSGIAAARVSGKAFANLRLSGQLPSLHSWRGNGSVRLFEADIYQLPLMVALLKLLKVQPPDATAFTQSDMEFRVEGDRLYFDRIALQGDAVSLVGNGEMDMQRNLKLDFGAVVGREDAQLPWFRPFALGAARSVLGIHVTGPLHQPLVTARPFPELNETLQQWFSDGVVDPGLPWSGIFGPRDANRSNSRRGVP